MIDRFSDELEGFSSLLSDLAAISAKLSRIWDHRSSRALHIYAGNIGGAVEAAKSAARSGIAKHKTEVGGTIPKPGIDCSASESDRISALFRAPIT